MKPQHYMGVCDGISRVDSCEQTTTSLSPDLLRRMRVAAIAHVLAFCQQEKLGAVASFDANDLESEYGVCYAEARELGLMSEGGISEKDHLCMWCLGRVLELEQYVESGVFIGSSLHAFIRSRPRMGDVTGIDPNLSNLRLTGARLGNVRLIDDQDFGEIGFSSPMHPHLLYFDDHINAAKRIIQAHEKGFRLLLFDDATGLEGICQRRFPAFPTIPIILQHRSLRVGDQIAWTCRMEPKATAGLRHRLNPWRRTDVGTRFKRLTITISDEVLALCKAASALIDSAKALPDLGDFVAQATPKPTVQSTKYLVRLSS